MIQVGNDLAAVAFLKVAINELQAAQALGADAGTLIALLQQVVDALSIP
jgi:hypothetical protein